MFQSQRVEPTRSQYVWQWIFNQKGISPELVYLLNRVFFLEGRAMSFTVRPYQSTDHVISTNIVTEGDVLDKYFLRNIRFSSPP